MCFLNVFLLFLDFCFSRPAGRNFGANSNAAQKSPRRNFGANANAGGLLIAVKGYMCTHMRYFLQSFVVGSCRALPS